MDIDSTLFMPDKNFLSELRRKLAPYRYKLRYRKEVEKAIRTAHAMVWLKEYNFQVEENGVMVIPEEIDGNSIIYAGSFIPTPPNVLQSPPLGSLRKQWNDAVAHNNPHQARWDVFSELFHECITASPTYITLANYQRECLDYANAGIDVFESMVYRTRVEDVSIDWDRLKYKLKEMVI